MEQLKTLKTKKRSQQGKIHCDTGNKTKATGRPRVVIIGAGFAGLRAARALASCPVEVLLLDSNNYHTFLPLLYQVGAAELESEEIAYPVRSILRRLPHIHFAMLDVKELDLDNRVVKGDGPDIHYDFLILAAGSTTHFLGVPGADKYAFPLKTLEEAITLRNHILCCFERAVREPDEEQRRRLLTFTVVGGGPTGVEFAGALAELIYGPLVKDYPTIDFCQTRVMLLEAANRLLSVLPERLSTYAVSRLQRMGVEAILQTVVSQVTGQALYLRDGTILPTETVVWTAGILGSSLSRTCGLPTTGNGRVTVLPTLQVPGHPEVYVAGDLAYQEANGHPLPMVAPAAIQQGLAAARNIGRQITGKSPLPFHYRNRGTMVTIGRNAGVAHLGGRSITGFSAWAIWLGIHLVNLIGFRNRLFVLLNWAWDYLFYERAVRLILPKAGQSKSSKPQEVRK